MIYLTWSCPTCDIEFTTSQEEPDCLKCKGPVTWVPAAGHGGIVSGATRAQDGYFKAQAARHGLTDLHSARAGEAMAPRMAAAPKRTQAMEVAPGISVPVQLNSRNQPVTSVENFVPAKGMLPAFGSAMPMADNRPSIASLTEVVGRYDGQK